MNRAAALLLAVTLGIFFGIQSLAPLTAQGSEPRVAPREAREALEIARTQQRNARTRAERLEAEADRAQEAEAGARTQAAALAARVQQAESRVAAAEAELVLVEGQRRQLSRSLARRREPLVQLTAALETMARRPLALAALQPGSLRNLVHTRAVLGSAIPVVNRRTAALRGELGRARALEEERRTVLAERRAAEERLDARRRDLVAVAEKERVLARQASGGASREAALAVELAEQARDLDALVGNFEQDAALRSRLAALDGPVARPARPGEAALPPRQRPRAAELSLGTYLLPVAGRVTAGFGEQSVDGARRPGIVMEPRKGAQVVAPAAGRIAFAGAYEGYGRIVIIEHGGEWTSLLTGLASVAVATGQEVGAGSPLGLASASAPSIGLELRRSGRPVNPLERLR